MNYAKIPKETRIVDPRCAPFFYSGTRESVLLLHGYTGTPYDMRYLAERLSQQKYTVYIPRLPGHGTNRRDFMQSKHDDWLREALDGYLTLLRLEKPVYVCGLSMGGVLALLLAEKFPIRKLCLCAPAVIVKNPVMKWTPFVKYFLKTSKRNHVEYQEDFLNVLHREYWSDHLIEKLADLRRLQNLCIKMLENVTSDCLLILARKDTVIPTDVSELLRTRTRAHSLETRVLEESGHVILNDCEKETAADLILRWLGAD
ncbi:MAG: alpha/beta fold hydrolase [Thermotogaceae bacterium]|nr:alpha/beta fold hydrolase [Thermotogaceae bacterium]